MYKSPKIDIAPLEIQIQRSQNASTSPSTYNNKIINQTIDTST